MSAELVVSGRDTQFWRRSAILAGSAGAGILLSDALVEKIVSEDVDDEETDRDEAELWRGGVQVALGLLAGRVLYGYSRDAAVGVAVGVAGKGIYRIADGLGAVEKVSEWFGLERDEDEELPESTTTHTCPTGQTWNESAQACRPSAGLPAGQRREVVVGEVLPRVGARR